jgi:geranylgeranyl diphosphate synthase type II
VRPADADDLRRYLVAARAQVDAALDRALPIPPACPARLGEAMRYSLFAGGKRFRPVLTLAAADATARSLGLDAEGASRAVAAALPAACAIEMIHTYSLIHDDLPAMDDDTLRRGRPTLHVVYGEGLAILAGDGLLTEAFALLAREPRGADADLAARKLRALEVIADAAGVAGMAGGQAIDLEAAGTGAAPAASAFDESRLRHMHACKTGALLRASAVSGAVMAGGSPEIIGAIGSYATELGLAFQIVDDILDVEGVAEELGKTAGKDAAAGKPTYPALFGLAASKRLAAESVARAHAAILAAGLADGYLPAIADWVVSRTH